MRLFDLKGRVAIVTGGNGGIGLGMARGLAEAGAAVVIAGRDQAKADAALAALGPSHLFLAADVTQAADCRSLVARTLDRYGRLDILVNNAGTSIRKPPEAYEEAEWRLVLDTNLTSTSRHSASS